MGFLLFIKYDFFVGNGCGTNIRVPVRLICIQSLFEIKNHYGYVYRGMCVKLRQSAIGALAKRLAF